VVTSDFVHIATMHEDGALRNRSTMYQVVRTGTNAPLQ